MSKLEVKNIYNAQRCEICHQTDLFDAQNNLCTRCKSLNTNITLTNRLELTIQQRIFNHNGWLDLNKAILGIIWGSIIGFTIGFIYSALSSTTYTRNYSHITTNSANMLILSSLLLCGMGGTLLGIIISLITMLLQYFQLLQAKTH